MSGPPLDRVPGALGPLDTLIAAMPGSVLAVNSDGLITAVNVGAETLFGYRREELLGQPVEMLLPERIRATHLKQRDGFGRAHEARAMGSRTDLMGCRRDGSEFPADICLGSVATNAGPVVIAVVQDVTDLEVAETARRRSESLSEAVISTLPAHIAVLDAEGVIVAVNEAYRLFALESGPDGHPVGAVGSSYFSGLTPHFKGEAATALFARDGILAVLGGSAPGFELEYACKAIRQPRWFLMQARPIGNGLRGVVVAHTDITSRKEAEEALRSLNVDLERRVEERTTELRSREARYSTLFQSIDEGFCIVEMIFDELDRPVDYRFLEVNPAFERHTGLGDAVGRRMRELAPDHEEHWFEIYGRVAREGQPIRFQNHAEQLNRYYDVYACRLGEASNRHVAIIFNDITDKRDMESRLREAKESAEQANLAKSEFLSRMSHELRTPLNAVIGYAQLLDLQFSDPAIKEAAEAISKGGRHLLNLINEILDLSRIEVGNLALSVEPVPFDIVLQQALSLVQPLANAGGVRLSIEGEVCERVHVEADRQRLVQVLINLLSNAIKFNRPGGQVTVRCLELTGGNVRIEVSDSGRGISKEDQERLFQPFQRFGDQGIEGTGLGLALCGRFVALMGGTIGLSASSPEGSTFFIEMKSIMAAYQEMTAPVSALSTMAMASRRGKVLYIEDNLSNMRLIEAVFANWKGLTLIPAMQGTVGIELAQMHHPDLILLDLHLPDLMGSKVLERLRTDPGTRPIPVVIVSADATQKQIVALLAAGAVDYLTKPLDLKLLVEVLEQYLPPED